MHYFCFKEKLCNPLCFYSSLTYTLIFCHESIYGSSSTFTKIWSNQAKNNKNLTYRKYIPAFEVIHEHLKVHFPNIILVKLEISFVETNIYNKYNQSTFAYANVTLHDVRLDCLSVCLWERNNGT